MISDTHGKHRELTPFLPSPYEVDMILHAGDVSAHGGIMEITSFINWYASLPHKYKIFIAGNHDFGFQDSYTKTKVKELLDQHPDIIYLEDQAVTIEGVKIYGSPWQPWFHDWAFNLKRGPDIAEKWKNIPEDTDILITHGPPFGHGDKTVYGEKVGCKDLLDRVLEVKPKIHMFGHIHEDYGMTAITDSTTAFNVSCVNRRYEVVNDPVIITYEDFV